MFKVSTCKYTGYMHLWMSSFIYEHHSNMHVYQYHSDLNQFNLILYIMKKIIMIYKQNTLFLQLSVLKKNATHCAFLQSPRTMSSPVFDTYTIIQCIIL